MSNLQQEQECDGPSKFYAPKLFFALSVFFGWAQ